jgi:hypothetical protein
MDVLVPRGDSPASCLHVLRNKVHNDHLVFHLPNRVSYLLPHPRSFTLEGQVASLALHASSWRHRHRTDT